MLQLNFLQEKTFNSWFWVSIDNFLLIHKLFFENLLFSSLRQNPDRLVMQEEVPLVSETLGFQNFLFKLGLAWFPPQKSYRKIKSFQLVWNQFAEKLSIFFPGCPKIPGGAIKNDSYRDSKLVFTVKTDLICSIRVSA